MSLDNEILKLSIMKKGSVVPIYQGNDATYLCRDFDGYAVAIPYDDDKILNESFVGITLSTNILNVEDKSFKVLYLYMVETGDLKKFAYIASEFIDLENRENLLHNPYSWIDAWNEMFGNSKKKYMISDVVAELAAFKEVYKLNKTAKWVGPKDGTHDIVYEGGVVEVKSTTNKKNNYVSINSQFQINPDENEKLFFVRLEPKPYAESIDTLVETLEQMGYSRSELEDNLSHMGYRAGNRTRKQTYDVLSIYSYKVDEDHFPVIVLDDLNSLSSVKNIIGYKFTLDLSAVPYEVIKWKRIN